MVTTKTHAELVKKDVFTTKGAYVGKVADVDFDLDKFRVKSLIIDAVRGSFLSGVVGERKGVIVPYQIVQAIGDIVIIKHIQPAQAEEQAAGGKEAQLAEA